jgi:hypothetical protein
LRIVVEYDASQADAAAQAFWDRERARQQQAAGAGPGGAPGGGAAAGGGTIPVAQAGGLPGMAGAFAALPTPQPMAAAGVLPGNMVGLAALGQMGQAAAGGGILPGMMIPPPAIGAAAQLGGAGGPGAMAALPAPAMGGALRQIGTYQGQQILAATSGGGMGALPPGGGIPISPTPMPGQPGAAPGAAGGGMPRGGGLMLAAAGLGIAKELQDAGLESRNEARGYLDSLDDQAARARTANREIAALRQLPNTAATAAMMAQEAAGAGLSADQWRDFQEGFQAYAGQYVGEGEGFKIDPAQAQRLQQAVAGFGVGSRGWRGSDASRLLGTVISKAKKGASDEEILGQYSQLAQVMQLAPGYTGPLLGQLSEVVGESVGEGSEFGDALDAAVLLRGVSERNPASASAYTRALLRGLRGVRMSEGKKNDNFAALGFTHDMNVWQQIEQVQKAADEARARGEDEGEFLSAHGFAEIRQYGGIRTALNSGLRGGGFERARREAGDRMEMAERLRSEFRSYVDSSEEGGYTSDKAALQAAQLGRAAREQEWQKFKRRAAVAVASSGEIESSESDINAFITGHGGSGMSRAQQEAHAEAARQLHMALEGSEAGRRYLAQPYRAPNNWSWSDSPLPGILPGVVRETRADYLTNHARDGEEKYFIEMALALKEIRSDIRRQTEMMQREAGRRAAVGAGAGAGIYGITVQMPGARDGRQSESGQGSW